MTSMLSPEMLGALVTNPDRMNSLDLYRYIQYLKQNKQQSDRYEIALWKRITYPFVIWVMMALALPVAFLQARSGAVGARVFAGIKARKVLIKNVSGLHPLLAGCLRITIGTAEENTLLLAAFEAALQESQP